MKLPTEKVQEGFTLESLRALFYGPSKIGKSTLASRFPDCLFLDTHRGTKALPVFPMHIGTWKDFLESVDLILSKKHDFKNVIFDLIEDIMNYGVHYVCTKKGMDHQSDLKWGKGWDLVLKELERPFLRLRASELGLIFISQEQEKEVTTKHSKYQKVGPAFTNQARKIIMPYVDVIGHCYVDDEGDEEVRKIQFDPTEYCEAGDRTGYLPKTIMLRYTSFKKAFIQGKASKKDDQ
jgi:hypothetical protein